MIYQLAVLNAHIYHLYVQVGACQGMADLHDHTAKFFVDNTGVQVYLYVKMWKKEKMVFVQW